MLSMLDFSKVAYSLDPAAMILQVKTRESLQNDYYEAVDATLRMRVPAMKSAINACFMYPLSRFSVESPTARSGRRRRVVASGPLSTTRPSR